MMFVMWPFKPAWMNKKEEKALRAVEKIKDQEELKKVIKESKLWRVVVGAIKKL
jgi:hypothetical protein